MNAEAAKIGQIGFAELHLGHPSLGDRIRELPGSGLRALPIDDALRGDVERIKATCVEARSRLPARTEFEIVHDNVAYRVFTMQTLKGPVFVLRKIADGVAALRLPPACVQRLTGKELSGLLLVAGPRRSGKTATACAIVRERLIRHGGVAATVEDPIELPLEGVHGVGICYQTLGSPEHGGIADIFRRTVRWRPQMVLVGEIRDRETAVELLRAGADGQLVISTLHADSIVKAIMKLQALVNDKLISGGTQLLADGLLGVLQQRPAPTPDDVPETEFLFLREAPTARANILHGDYEMLEAGIRRHAAVPAGADAAPGAGAEPC